MSTWTFRNAVLAGHEGLTSQTGASFAYHKAVDVVLWREGRSRLRFSGPVLAEVRDRFDAELRDALGREVWPAHARAGGGTYLAKAELWTGPGD